MTEREVRRRTYLEAANALLNWLNQPLEEALTADEERVDDALRAMVGSFQAAADAIKETQEAGIP